MTSKKRSRWSRVTLGVAALFLSSVTCRTPPPLPKSAAEPDEPPQPTVPTQGPPSDVVVPAAPGPDESGAAEASRDFAAEQGELAERYGKRRALATLRGEASYYGAAFAGRTTASGERFEPHRFTAAHRTLPFGTVLRVTRVGTRSVVYVRVNDRGPFGRKRRILDLSEGAAKELGMLRDGVCEVRAEVVERGKP